ncbi:MAG: DUF362 domain-containing protein, partial [Candidatus Zixiibacteriota bacterium]
YPELEFCALCTGRNLAYEGVRQALRLAGLDAGRYGRADWNPLGEFIRAGDTVLLKPNLVKEKHPRDPRGWEYVLTHGSVIRAAADYVFKALGGSGAVIVGDAPQTDSSFSKIANVLQLHSLVDHYRRRGLDFRLVDFRKEEWTNEGEVIVRRLKLDGDPDGYVAFDLAENSEFHGHKGVGRYYGADYDAGVVNSHHDGNKNEYLISGAAIKCDVYFNLPKLKTHKKAGVTINLKNLVGVNGDKNWLPHHTEGAPVDGGDQFPDFALGRRSENWMVHSFKRLSLALPGLGPRLMKVARPVGKRIFGDTDGTIRSGNWSGNDTVWRMSLDLNKLVMYGNMDGTLRAATPENRKPYLCLVDGIIAGQGAGPMNPDPFPAGVILFGRNPATVDAVGATLMGFDIAEIPIVRNAFKARRFHLTDSTPGDIRCRSNFAPWDSPLNDIDPETLFDFTPHFGWTGKIELAAPVEA